MHKSKTPFSGEANVAPQRNSPSITIIQNNLNHPTAPAMPFPTISPQISLPTILSQITEVYSPRLVANINREYDIKIAKIRGPFIWHSHPDTDELFYVLNGSLTIQIEIGKDVDGGIEGGGRVVMEVEYVVLVKGDVFVVPKGHRPVTGEEEGDGAEVMMIERCGTVNTGDEVGSGMMREVVDVRGG